jgi:hypothetical protein
MRLLFVVAMNGRQRSVAAVIGTTTVGGLVQLILLGAHVHIKILVFSVLRNFIENKLFVNLNSIK